jgi:hypothetical protein
MSWDVLFQDLPDGLKSVRDVPDDFQPTRPLCNPDELLAKIQSIAPDADISDPTWVVLDADGFSIELNIGDHDPVRSITLHVRGDDDGAIGVIQDLAAALGRTPIDCSAGELLDFNSPNAAAGLRQWRAYRDRMVSGGDDT